jgi:predicted cobalt transporter CbtA
VSPGRLAAIGAALLVVCAVITARSYGENLAGLIWGTIGMVFGAVVVLVAVVLAERR